MADRRFAHPARPLQFRAGASPIHRLGAGSKLLAAMGIGALGLALGAVAPLHGLLLAVAVSYGLAGLAAGDLWRDARWILLQGAVIVILTVVVRGQAGLAQGYRTALQLVLVFLPFALVLRTTRTEDLLAPLRDRLPERMGFAVGATLRFVPLFTRELAELVEMQRMRGARLTARELWRPGAWRDWLACIALPMTARAIEIAEEAAEAAEIRGVGVAHPSIDTQGRNAWRPIG